MAEWLGTGLQNLLQRFNSASRLQILLVQNEVELGEKYGCAAGSLLRQNS